VTNFIASERVEFLFANLAIGWDAYFNWLMT